MTQEKKNDLGKTRLNINLPNSILEKVKEYADSLGINTTSAITILLNQAFEQKEMLNSLPLIFQAINDMKALEDKDTKSQSLE